MLYPKAVHRGTGGAFFEVRNTVAAGVRWSRIDARYDPLGRLVRLRLYTRAFTYEQLEAEMSKPDSPLWDIGGDGPGSRPARRVLLCDYGTSVSLQFERPDDLPQGIVAQAR